MKINKMSNQSKLVNVIQIYV